MMNSLLTLKRDLFVYKNGDAKIPLDIVSTHVRPHGSELPIILNENATQIIILKNPDLDAGEKPIYFLPFEQSEDSFIIHLSRKRYFQKFLNRFFDVQLSKDPYYIMLNFKKVEEKRYYTTNINDGVLILKNETPLDIFNNLRNKKYYYSLKISCFKTEHSKDYQNIYDILISSSEKYLNYFKTSNSFLKKEDKNLHYLFLHKKEFSDFLKSTSSIHLRIFLKEHPNNKKGSIYFPLNEVYYDKFLLKKKYFSSEQLSLEKKRIIKGTAQYFAYIEKFLRQILSGKIKVQKKYYQLIKNVFNDINLNRYDFTSIYKREKFSSRVKIFFLENQDIFITRDLNFKIDPKINVFKEELLNTWKKGHKKYLSDHHLFLSKNQKAVLDDEEISMIFILLTDLRLTSKVEIRDHDASMMMFYISILKSRIHHFKSHPLFQGRSSEFYNKIPFILGMFNLFKEIQPTHELCSPRSLYFQQYFISGKSMSKTTLMKMFLFSNDILYFSHIAQDLKYFKQVYGYKFDDISFFDDILTLSYDLCNISKNSLHFGYHSLTSTIFTLFVLSLELDKEKYLNINARDLEENFLSNVRFVLESDKMIKFVRGKESIQIPKDMILTEYSLDPSKNQSIRLKKKEELKEVIRGNFGKWITSSKISLSSICNTRHYQVHMSSLYQKIDKFINISHRTDSVKENGLFSVTSRELIKSSITNFFLSSFIHRLKRFDKFKTSEGSIDHYKFNIFTSEIFHKISFFIKNDFFDMNEKHILQYFTKIQALLQKNNEILTSENKKKFSRYFNFQVPK